MAQVKLTSPFGDRASENEQKETIVDYNKKPNELPIGLTFQKLDADMLLGFGIEGLKVGLAVVNVEGYAGRLGFQTGDVLTHLNDEAIKGERHYRELVDFSKPNTEVRIGYFRNGSPKVVKLYRVWSYGIYLSKHSIYTSLFTKNIDHCHIKKVNNKAPNSDMIKTVIAAEFMMLMLSCPSESNPRFVKVTRKYKMYGRWADEIANGWYNDGWL